MTTNEIVAETFTASVEVNRLRVTTQASTDRYSEPKAPKTSMATLGTFTITADSIEDLQQKVKAHVDLLDNRA